MDSFNGRRPGQPGNDDASITEHNSEPHLPVLVGAQSDHQAIRCCQKLPDAGTRGIAGKTRTTRYLVDEESFNRHFTAEMKHYVMLGSIQSRQAIIYLGDQLSPHLPVEGFVRADVPDSAKGKATQTGARCTARLFSAGRRDWARS